MNQKWNDAWERWMEFSEFPETPPPPMPTMNEWIVMFLIALIYWGLYHGYGPDACGDVGTEPRDTWDAGGSFGDGFRAMWGL